MSCATGCYQSTTSCCENILVRAAFPPLYPLYWVIQKPGQPNIYQALTETNAEGDLLIDKTKLPAGFLTPGTIFNLKIKNGANYLQPVVMVFDGVQYGCVTNELLNIERNDEEMSEVNVIQFTEAIVPEGGGTGPVSLVIPFVNQTSVSYAHNLNRPVDVTAYNLAGELLNGSVDVSNPNVVTVTFSPAQSGRLLIQ